MVVYHVPRNSVLARDPNPVEIDRSVRQDWIRARAQTRSSGKDRRVSRGKNLCRCDLSKQTGVEVTQAIVRFVSMGYAIPSQSQIQCELLAGAPVVLYVRRPGNVVILTAVVHSVFAVTSSVAQQEVRESVAGVGGGAEVIAALRNCKDRLRFLPESPTSAHLDLMRSLHPRNVVPQLIPVGDVRPRSPVGGVLPARSRSVTQVDSWNAAGGPVKILLGLKPDGSATTPVGVILIRLPL